MKQGLRIRTAAGVEFEISGKATKKEIPGDGTIYYCDGQSWPAEIVIQIIE